jgi:FkbM family methyltransferase
MIDLNCTLRGVRLAALARAIHSVLGAERRVMETPVGRMFLDPVFGIGGSIAGTGSFEPQMERTLSNELQYGMTFIDLGANEGYFTLQRARLVGPTGLVFAVEPQKQTYPGHRTKPGVERSQQRYVVNAAISDLEGSRTSYLPPEPAHAGFTLPTQQVKTITLANLFAQCGIENVDVMKVDIEGAEYEAILGSREIFNEHLVKVLALDLHLTQLGNARTDKLIAFVEGCGYRLDTRYRNTVWRAP